MYSAINNSSKNNYQISFTKTSFLGRGLESLPEKQWRPWDGYKKIRNSNKFKKFASAFSWGANY